MLTSYIYWHYLKHLNQHYYLFRKKKKNIIIIAFSFSFFNNGKEKSNYGCKKKVSHAWGCTKVWIKGESLLLWEWM